jgi:amino acid transporter
VDLGRAVEFPAGVPAGTAVLSAARPACCSFIGFETSATVAEEVRDVRRSRSRPACCCGSEARTWALAGVLVAVGVLLHLGTALPRRRTEARDRARETARVSRAGR